jgi:hypothetical protein
VSRCLLSPFQFQCRRGTHGGGPWGYTARLRGGAADAVPATGDVSAPEATNRRPAASRR